MTEVILFNSPINNEKKDVLEISGSYPRIGIASIATCLSKKGIEANIIDPNAEKLNIEKIKLVN